MGNMNSKTTLPGYYPPEVEPRRPKTGSTPRWEHFEHGSDIGVRGVGMTLEEAFEQAALALTAVVTDPANVAPLHEVAFQCAASDAETLLVEWLNALVYEMAVRNMLFSRFRVHLSQNQLSGSAWGQEIDIARHEPAVEVKGATYTSMFVGQRTDGSWVAQCVVDV
jgi:SHS2 domain-containing protein